MAGLAIMVQYIALLNSFPIAIQHDAIASTGFAQI